MFATEEYIESVLALYSFEGSVLGYTKVVHTTNYNNVLHRLLSLETPKHERIRILASWGIPETLSNIHYPDSALKTAKKVLQLLKDGKKLPKQFDGMIAKAIQSLRFHMEYSYTEFIE